MECNKEEAIRAKGIAENKMLSKDFIAARKIVLKAQQLYPDLENVPQMLTVCEIHCSAENKLNGEMDWYGILQVPTNADELTIKKQYRKLALLLHPDKNQFGGAEAAFKLVGEAHRTLTDKSKRVLHDMKRAASFRTVPVKQPAPRTNISSSVKKQPGVASSFANSTFARSNGLNQQQSASFTTNQTFWTICPSCGIRYQYYQSIMNRALRCQSCKKPFIAYDINAQSVPSAAPWNRNGIPQQEKRVPTAHFAGPKSNFGCGSDMGSQGNVVGGSAASQPHSKSGCPVELGGTSNNNQKEDVKADVDSGKFEKVKLQEVKKREQAVKSSAGSRTQKRGRKVQLESSESESSDSDVVVEAVYPSEQNMGTAGSCPRRSSRQKQNISYSEDQSDDDFVSLKHKRSRIYSTPGNTNKDDPNCVNGQTSEAAASAGKKHSTGSENGVQKREQCRNGKGEGSNIGDDYAEASANSDFSSEASPDDPEAYTYPDPEFYDFDEGRDESRFAVDQIWAVYDNFDAMPRYYAWIRHVQRPKFKLRFNWLEYDPASKAETVWYDGGLPVGCGTFKLGKREQTEERLMFSHIMPRVKREKKNTYVIFPRKGEVWALFKNWDIEWSCMDTNRHYEYEIVEVISDLTESDVISVVRLIKVQGFVSLFVQAIDSGSSPLNIQMKDILQFSHSIPSYRLKGNEREGVPKGSLELDCASLPLNFVEMLPSISVDSLMGRSEDLNNVSHGLYSAGAKDEVPSRTCNKSSTEVDGSAIGSQCYTQSEQMMSKEQVGAKENVGARDAGGSTSVKNHSVSQQSSSNPYNWYEYPDSEFHNFGEEKSADKFEEGQIWALYSEVDKNPNYYGQITKIESESSKVHLNWLEGYCEEEHEKFWFDEQLPVGCGTMKVTPENFVLDSMDTVSHLAYANPTAAKRNQYSIYPSTGEIWAVYKNWSLGWTRTDHQNCDFHVVEILLVNSLGFEVSVLSKVNGYRAVFKAESGVSARTMFIPFAERLKFSHKIPSFRLTEERGGKLRGYWELDPGAIPDLLLVEDYT